MTYLATSINNSPVITEKAGAAIESVRGKAVKYDGSGNVILCSSAGEAAIGIATMTNDDNIGVGAAVDIQIKDIGLVLAGGTITKGAELAVNTSGAFVTAAAGNSVVAIALDAAKSGDYFKAMMVRYQKPTA